MFNDEYIPGNQWVSPASPYYDAKLPGAGSATSRGRRQLLREAGQPNLAFTLIVPPERDRQEAALIIQAMLRRRPGITMTIQTQENVTMLQTGRQGDFEAYFTFWSGRPDPDGNIFTFITCKRRARTTASTATPDVDALLTKARHVADPAERKKLYDQATEISLRDMPRLHLWHRRVFTGLQRARSRASRRIPDGIIRLNGPQAELRRRTRAVTAAALYVARRLVGAGADAVLRLGADLLAPDSSCPAIAARGARGRGARPGGGRGDPRQRTTSIGRCRCSTASGSGTVLRGDFGESLRSRIPVPSCSPQAAGDGGAGGLLDGDRARDRHPAGVVSAARKGTVGGRRRQRSWRSPGCRCRTSGSASC